MKLSKALSFKPYPSHFFAVSLFNHPKKKELIKLTRIAVSLFLLCSLLSYSPWDTSMSSWGTLHQTQNWMGSIGSGTSDILFQLFGITSLLLAVYLLFPFTSLPKLVLLSLFASLLSQLCFPENTPFWQLHNGGGLLGFFMSKYLSIWFGKLGAWASLIFSVALYVVLKMKKTIPAPTAVSSTTTEAEEPASVTQHHDTDLDRLSHSKTGNTPKQKFKRSGKFNLPSLDLVSGKADSKTKHNDKAWLQEKGQILVQKLKDFGVEGEIVNVSSGPVITVYEFKPASGVKIKEIANLSDDLTLALSVLSVRIVAPIPGKPVVGIEIPTPHRETVFFKDIVKETPFHSADTRLPIVLGRLASGEPVISGLGAMPHLLVAGSTGTGKSVFINTMICSLLYRFSPDQLRLILVDPKMVELSSYEAIPHLLLPVVVDSRKAAMALRWTVEEMERRYTLMHQSGVRHLDAYNEKVDKGEGDYATAERIPYIVVVIDEYADLMAVAQKDVEMSITRLAQKARASGIHLVLATQRPSTDVVTGLIKANFPSRISFRVASSVDSKTILDRTGAERLLGNGDMLFHSAGFMSLKRMQGAFISDADIEKVVTSLKAQGQPVYDERLLHYEETLEENGATSSDGSNPSDKGLYDQAVRIVSERGEASISLLQRHLKIGYNRAASLMEELEKEGVVAQATGQSKRRQVLVGQI